MINVENLTKYFDDFCAVDGINLNIQKGEILGVLGPNGAGKTTTLRMLTGFLKPSAGEVRVKKYSIDDNALAIKTLLGYLPESAPLYHDMLVFDYLDYVADIRTIRSKEKPQRIRQVADLCGINEVMHRPISLLSKGYKQRVGLAHAMINDPEILVLDEPTSGLDPNQIVEIRDIIKQIGKTKTIILSSHILSEVEATCDRVVILHQGKIAADGTTETLRQGTGDNVTIRISLLNADLDVLKTKLAPVSQITAIEEIRDKHTENGDTLHVKLSCRSSIDLRGDIYRIIKETDWILLEFRQEAQSLENIFRQLTMEN